MKIIFKSILLCSFFIGCNMVSELPHQNNSSFQTTQSQQLLQQSPKHKLPLPLIDAEKRVTKKPFGIKISPQNSPVQPERFTGYHTATDFETFLDEQTKDVTVSAICDGEILLKRKVTGYGGILIQSCILGDLKPVTVLYGHINLASVQQEIGDQLKAGESFALLGAPYSTDTGGERKHLHLGIHRGTSIELKGYVQNQAQLQDWIDFETLL